MIKVALCATLGTKSPLPAVLRVLLLADRARGVVVADVRQALAHAIPPVLELVLAVTNHDLCFHAACARRFLRWVSTRLAKLPEANSFHAVPARS